MPSDEIDKSVGDTRLRTHSITQARNVVFNAVGLRMQEPDHLSYEMKRKGRLGMARDLRPAPSQDGMSQFLPEQIKPRIARTKAQQQHDLARRFQDRAKSLVQMSPSQKSQYLAEHSKNYPTCDWSKPAIAKPGPAISKPTIAPKAKRLQPGRTFHHQPLIKPSADADAAEHGVRAYFGS